MQLISAKPLIRKFRDGSFKEAEVGPYFMAHMILMAVVMGIAFGEPNPWEITAGVLSVVITVFGVLHLRKRNGGSFGDHFLSKYFCLGWVVTVRMLCLCIPAAVVLFLLASAVGEEEAVDAAGALFTVVFEILFYGWLGSLISRSRRMESEEVAGAEALS